MPYVYRTINGKKRAIWISEIGEDAKVSETEQVRRRVQQIKQTEGSNVIITPSEHEGQVLIASADSPNNRTLISTEQAERILQTTLPENIKQPTKSPTVQQQKDPRQVFEEQWAKDTNVYDPNLFEGTEKASRSQLRQPYLHHNLSVKNYPAELRKNTTKMDLGFFYINEKGARLSFTRGVKSIGKALGDENHPLVKAASTVVGLVETPIALLSGQGGRELMKSVNPAVSYSFEWELPVKYMSTEEKVVMGAAGAIVGANLANNYRYAVAPVGGGYESGYTGGTTAGGGSYGYVELNLKNQVSQLFNTNNINQLGTATALANVFSYGYGYRSPELVDNKQRNRYDQVIINDMGRGEISYKKQNNSAYDYTPDNWWEDVYKYGKDTPNKTVNKNKQRRIYKNPYDDNGELVFDNPSENIGEVVHEDPFKKINDDIFDNPDKNLNKFRNRYKNKYEFTNEYDYGFNYGFNYGYGFGNINLLFGLPMKLPTIGAKPKAENIIKRFMKPQKQVMGDYFADIKSIDKGVFGPKPKAIEGRYTGKEFRPLQEPPKKKKKFKLNINQEFDMGGGLPDMKKILKGVF